MERRTSDFRRRTSTRSGGRCMRRPRVARSLKSEVGSLENTRGLSPRRLLLTQSRRGAESAEEYAYQYDDIGNRVASTDLGTNRTYTANFLNQYTLISNLCDSVTLCDDFVPQYDLDGNQTLVKTSTGVWHKIHGDSPRATPKSGWPRKEQVDLSYDEETNHGANPDKQKEWGEKWPTLN